MSDLLQWQIGDIKIHRVIDLNRLTMPIADLIEGATPDVLEKCSWVRPHYMTDAGEVIVSFHAFLVQTPDHTIVIDTCIGNDKNWSHEGYQKLQTPFLENFRATGIEPEDVDVVFCTHLHFDHVGWNTRLENGRWIPTFPNARYLFDKTEFEAMQAHGGPAADNLYPDNIAPVIDAGLAHFIDAENYAVSDEIRLIPTPGHTVAHTSVLITSRGQEAVITGDLIHSPVQCVIYDLPCVADVDKVLSAKTRHAFLTKFSDSGALILGTHFPAPTGGRLVRDGMAWRFRTGK